VRDVVEHKASPCLIILSARNLATSRTFRGPSVMRGWRVLRNCHASIKCGWQVSSALWAEPDGPFSDDDFWEFDCPACPQRTLAFLKSVICAPVRVCLASLAQLTTAAPGQRLSGFHPMSAPGREHTFWTPSREKTRCVSRRAAMMPCRSCRTCDTTARW